VEELTGKTLGEFVLRQRIGEGGFGAVYRAEQPLLGREAVVKILHRRLRANDTSIQRFLREARLASRLDHPYAAHVYAFGAEPDGLVWIAMEFVRGTPLDSWIADKGPLSIDEMVPFFERLAEVVHSVHEHGIVHRDLKPSNVMVTTRAGKLLPKLLDLGIAKVMGENADPEPAEEEETAPPVGMTVEISGRAAALGGELEAAVSSRQLLVTRPVARPRSDSALGKAETIAPLTPVPPASLDSIARTPANRRRGPSVGLEKTGAVDPNAMAKTVGATPTPESDVASKSSGTSLTDSLPLAARLTQAGAVIGSPPYMAPEQWADAWSAGPSADVYSLGILIFECLTGRRPYHAVNAMAFLEQHLNAPIPPIGERFPRALDRFFARALAKRAEERFATALELASALRIACGKADETTTLPRLEPAVRDVWLADGPEPIAGSIAMLEAARNAHQARDATWDVVRAVVRYLLTIALATRAQIRGDTDSPQLVDLLRAMRTRELADEERVRLLRLLVRPFGNRSRAYPVPELVDLVASPKEGERHVLDRLFELRTSSDANQRADDLVRSHLARLLPAVAQFLRATSFVLDYPLVVTTRGEARGAAAERWMGLRRARRPAAALASGKADLEPHRALLLDRDGKIVQHLYPVVQVVPPSTGLPDEMFFFEGRGRHGALMIATPTGYERHDPTLWDWLGEHALGDSESSEQRSEERAPYLGLATFQASDADRFVGREREVDTFVNRLRVSALQVVVGASGAGKSSFVHAGVIPALPKAWKVVTLRPGATPIATLIARLAAQGVVIAETPPDALIGALRSQPTGTTLLVVVDQLEEMFTACGDEAERARFATLLAQLSASPDEPFRVVATIRDDFLMKLETVAPLRAQLSSSLVLLGNPSVDDLVRTVVEPARRIGYALSDDELARDMAAAVAERPGALALLSFTASQLWDLRDRRFKQLTRTAYDAMGGVGGALGRHAETTLENIPADDQALVQAVFCRLVTSDGTRALISRVELRQVLASPRADVVIEKLIAARLISVVDAEGEGRVELVHEALIGAWPRLGNWLREDVDGARMRDQLHAAAKQWQERDRPKDLLWRGDLLAELERWRRRPDPVALADVEAAFADASRADAARTRRRRQAIVVGMFAILTAAVVVLVRLNATAREQRALASENARRADASAAESQRRLASQYEEQGRLALLGDRSGPALLYFVAAIEQGAPRSPALDFMIDYAVHRLEAQRAVLRGHTDRINMVDLSPDGKQVLTASSDGTVRAWSLDTFAQTLVITTGDPNVLVARWSPTGDTILTAGDGGVPKLYARDGKLLHELRHFDTPSWMTPAFSPDGARVLVPYSDGALVLWDVATGKQLVTATSQLPTVFSAAITPDGKAALVWGDRAFFPEVRDASTLALITTLDKHKRGIEKIALSRTHVAIASRDKTTTIWDTTTWKLVHHLRGETNVVEDVSFDADGKRLVTTNRDGTARVWDVATGEPVAFLRGHQSAVRTARFSPDGTRVVTASVDGTARLWDTASGVPLATFEGHGRELTSVAITNDLVVTAAFDATARVYPSTGHRVLSGNIQIPTQLSLSADGKRLAAGAARELRVWDMAGEKVAFDLAGALDAKLDPRDPSRLVAIHPTEVQLLVDQAVTARAPVNVDLVGFLPDKRIVTVGEKTVRIWDPSTGKLTKLAEHTGYILALDVADDLVVTGGIELARISRPSTGSSIALPSKEPILVVAIDPTRKYVVTGSAEEARVWDAETGRLLHTLATPESTKRIAFDGRGHVLTAGSLEAIAQIWKLADGAHVATLEGHTQKEIVGAVFFQDDLVATAGDETVRIWEASTGRPLAISRTHGIAIASATFRTDVRQVITGAYDRQIVVQSFPERHLDLAQLRKITGCLMLKLEAGRLVAAAPKC
jgi:WD40 repeat protein/serine/threonine protein kinase